RELATPWGHTLRLPPSLYWIATFNTDTGRPQRLGPRLLDRVAWIEVAEPLVGQVVAPHRDQVAEVPPSLPAALLDALRGDPDRRGGRFAQLPDPAGSRLPANGERCMGWLHTLQARLRPFGG